MKLCGKIIVAYIDICMEHIGVLKINKYLSFVLLVNVKRKALKSANALIFM